MKKDEIRHFGYFFQKHHAELVGKDTEIFVKLVATLAKIPPKTKDLSPQLGLVEDYLRRSNLGVFEFRLKAISALTKLKVIKSKLPKAALRQIQGLKDFYSCFRSATREMVET